MSVCLGLDTSNYTTSAAIWQDGAIHQVKRLLPVKPGELGLRQSDAVFHHVRQLPDIVEELRGLCDAPITAIAASDRPQQREGSYMPCFLAGMGAARELAAVLHVPCYRFTHQQGHVAAALFGSGAHRVDTRAVSGLSCLRWDDRRPAGAAGQRGYPPL